MDCTHLNTAAEVLEAFRACNNPGEQIELFECLATRPEPPLEVFAELLENIHLEPVLALTIQAFGKITDADIKTRLKQSNELLAMLSKQAQLGATDLIRWSAATTIEDVGFDFIAISRHFSEEPRKIADKIVQSNIKRFRDKNLVNSNDYDEFIRFWTYGIHDKLREVTLGLEFWDLCNRYQNSMETMAFQDEDLNMFDVCWKIINALALRGIKEINAALRRAEKESAFQTDENELFEGIGLMLANFYGNDSGLDTKLLCLQSNNPRTRYEAARNLSSHNSNLLNNKLTFVSSNLLLAISTFSKEQNSINYYYSQLNELSKNLDELSRTLSRNKVRLDCQYWYNIAVQELSERRKRFDVRYKQSIDLRVKLDNNLNQLRSINRELYDNLFAKLQFEQPPKVSVEDERYPEVLTSYEQYLRHNLSQLSNSISDFYSSDCKVKNFQQELEKVRTEQEVIDKKLKELYKEENRILDKKSSLDDVTLSDIIIFVLFIIVLVFSYCFAGIIYILLREIIQAILWFFIKETATLVITCLDIGVFSYVTYFFLMAIYKEVIEKLLDKSKNIYYGKLYSSNRTEIEILQARNMELQQARNLVTKSINEICIEEKQNVLKLLLI